jgi:hypothetical protein
LGISFFFEIGAAPKGLDAINNQRCKYKIHQGPPIKKNCNTVPSFFRKDLTYILEKAIRSFAVAGETGAQTAAVLTGAGDETTWHQENGKRRRELDGGPPFGG